MLKVLCLNAFDHKTMKRTSVSVCHPREPGIMILSKTMHKPVSNMTILIIVLLIETLDDHLHTKSLVLSFCAENCF